MECSPSLGSPGGFFILGTMGQKGIHALLQDKDVGWSNNSGNTVIIIFTKRTLRAGCCVSTSEHYYLIHTHSNHLTDEEVNPEELGGWPQVSAGRHSGAWEPDLLTATLYWRKRGTEQGSTLCGGPHVGFLAPHTLVWQLQLRIHLMSPGTSVPQGTGPDTGNTKRPLEFCTLSFRNMDTWGNKYTCHFSWYVFLDTRTLRKGSI